MSEEKLDKIIASQARTEVHVSTIQRDLAQLTEHSNTRLNAHAKSLRSFEKTRDRQWGAAKLGAGLVTISGVIIGWFKFG